MISLKEQLENEKEMLLKIYEVAGRPKEIKEKIEKLTEEIERTIGVINHG